MRKPGIDVANNWPAWALPVLNAIKENIEILSGRRGGAFAVSQTAKAPSVGVDVAAVTGTQVTKKTEFDLLQARVQLIENTLNAVIARLNTP